MKLISHPILCNYYLTYRCNAFCDFCDIWEKPSPYVTLEEVKANLLDLKKLGVKVIDFTGGEPLLHRQLPEFLSLAKSMGFITTVTTNALLYPKLAYKLKGKVDMLHFSLDFADALQHNKTRGVECFDFVMQSIRLAKSIGEKPDILFTVFKENIGELEKVYNEVCLPNGLVLIVNPVFDYNDINNHGGLTEDQLIYLRQFSKNKLVYLNDAFVELRLDKGNNIRNAICKAASTTIVISPENKLLLPCYHLSVKEFEINQSLYQVWNSAEVQAVIEMEGKLEACQGCAINCYMQPTFATHFSKYWLKALPSTLKYNFLKGTWKNLFC